MSMTMATIATVTAMAAVAAGCGSGKASNVAAIPIATIRQQYTAAADPANGALQSLLQRALAYGGGSTADIDGAIPAATTTLKSASGHVGAIAAPEPLRGDILDAARALNAVVGDLGPLRAARGNDVSPAIARFVADAGRAAAADNLVRLLILQETTPTTEPPPTAAPPPATVAPPTTVARRTTTTRPRTTTTLRHAVVTTTPTTLKH